MALYLTAIFSFPPQFGRRGWAFLGCLRCGCQGNTLADQGLPATESTHFRLTASYKSRILKEA